MEGKRKGTREETGEWVRCRPHVLEDENSIPDSEKDPSS